jgi:hypothetical protein
MRDGEDERDRPIRGDREGRRHTGLDGRPGIAAQRHRQRAPLAHEILAAASAARPAVFLPAAGIELDDSVDRSTFCGQPAYEDRRRQQPSGYLGHHRLGQGQLAAGSAPGGLQRGGVGTVLALDNSGGGGWSQPESARGRPADKSSEDRIAVETRHAQPIE